MRVCPAAGLVLMLALPATALAAGPANAERGRLLYENHCRVCHTSEVHRRPNRIVLTPADLRAIVRQWQAAEKLRWSDEDIEDVATFLQQTRYRF